MPVKLKMCICDGQANFRNLPHGEENGYLHVPLDIYFVIVKNSREKKISLKYKVD